MIFAKKRKENEVIATVKVYDSKTFIKDGKNKPQSIYDISPEKNDENLETIALEDANKEETKEDYIEKIKTKYPKLSKEKIEEVIFAALNDASESKEEKTKKKTKEEQEIESVFLGFDWDKNLASIKDKEDKKNKEGYVKQNDVND